MKNNNSTIPTIYGINRTTGTPYVTVVVDGRTQTFNGDHPAYKTVINAIKNSKIDLLRSIATIKELIQQRSGGKFVVENGVLKFDGKPVNSAIADRIVGMFNNGLDVQPYVKFMQNLVQNESKTAIEELYLFLESCTLPITDDGHFLAYKMVNNDYTSIYDSKTTNNIGEIVKMDRAAVDPSRERTCSYGLHFASLEYVEKGSYGSVLMGHRLLVLKINPKDVVSIPSDYNNSKGRASEYLVLEEIEWGEHITPYDSTKYLDDDCDDDCDDDYDDDYDDAENVDVDLAKVTVQPRNVPVANVNQGVKMNHKLAKGLRATYSRNPHLSYAALGKQYGISARQAGRIVKGEAWV